MEGDKDNKKGFENKDLLFKFLEQTKEGVFAPIEESSLKYVRIMEETEIIEDEEDQYYYNIS